MDGGAGHGQALQGHLRLAEEHFGQGVVVLAEHHHPADAGGRQRLGAGGAGHVGDVGGGAVQADPVTGGLAEGVDLGVVRAHAVVVHHQAPRLVAVRRPRERPVVTGGQHEPLLDHHAPAVHARTGGALRRQHGQLQKIFVPGGPRMLGG